MLNWFLSKFFPFQHHKWDHHYLTKRFKEIRQGITPPTLTQTKPEDDYDYKDNLGNR